MALKSSITGDRGRNDLLLQKITRETIAYRVIDSSEPTERDFISHYHRGDRPREGLHYKAFSWLAVSMFTDPKAEKLDRIVNFIHASDHRPAHLARVALIPGRGIWVVHDPRNGGHLDVFGLPQDLLDCVDRQKIEER